MRLFDSRSDGTADGCSAGAMGKFEIGKDVGKQGAEGIAKVHRSRNGSVESELRKPVNMTVPFNRTSTCRLENEATHP
jgi:hypothetical protein